MIRQIFGWLVFAILVIGIGAWLMSGGFSRALTYAQSLADFGSYLNVNATSTGGPFKLPGQPDFSNTVGNSLETETGYVDNYTSPYNDPSYRPELTPDAGTAGGAFVDDTSGGNPASDPRTFGNPSPYAGHITFVAHNPSTDPSLEYLVIQAAGTLPAPISLAGWSLQSAFTGARVALPQASETFIQGTLNTSGPAVLAAESAAVITTGVSPVGVSYHSNRCSGYLAQLQTFSPAIAPQCPTAIENSSLQGLDPQCIEYLSAIPVCHFPGSPAVQNPAVPEACRTAAANALSYNGCVHAFRTSPGFQLPEWRLYLAITQPLWKPAHETIRLLDNEGRVVDVLTY